MKRRKVAAKLEAFYKRGVGGRGSKEKAIERREEKKDMEKKADTHRKETLMKRKQSDEDRAHLNKILGLPDKKVPKAPARSRSPRSTNVSTTATVGDTTEMASRLEEVNELPKPKCPAVLPKFHRDMLHHHRKLPNEDVKLFCGCIIKAEQFRERHVLDHFQTCKVMNDPQYGNTNSHLSSVKLIILSPYVDKKEALVDGLLSIMRKNGDFQSLFEQLRTFNLGPYAIRRWSLSQGSANTSFNPHVPGWKAPGSSVLGGQSGRWKEYNRKYLPGRIACLLDENGDEMGNEWTSIELNLVT